MRKSKSRSRDGIYWRDETETYWASYTDERGRRRRHNTKADSHATATAVRARWIAEIDEVKRFGREPDRILHNLVSQYIEAHASKPTLDRDGYSIRHLYRILGDRLLLNSLHPSDIHRYKTHRQREGAAIATINKEIGLLSAMLNWAISHLGWRIDNPAQRHREPEPPGRDRWLTQEEAGRLLVTAQQEQQAPHLHDFIMLGLYVGFRPGEILGLEWSRVDLSKNRVYLGIEDQKGRRRSAVDLNQQARAAIIRRARFRAEHCPGSPWVFCDQSGKRIASVKRSFATAARRAGLEDVRPHDLRRTCGSWLIQAGIPLHVVSKILRHTDTRVTEHVYAHLSPTQLADAISVLDRHKLVTSSDDRDGKKEVSS